MESFWNRVKTLLNTTSVVELSQILEVKRTTLSSWIHSDRRPPMAVLLRITELTGVDLHHLERGYAYDFEEEDEVADSRIHTKRSKLIELVNSLDEDELEIVSDFFHFCEKRIVKTQTPKKDGR